MKTAILFVLLLVVSLAFVFRETHHVCMAARAMVREGHLEAKIVRLELDHEEALAALNAEITARETELDNLTQQFPVPGTRPRSGDLQVATPIAQ